jgi:predicted transcriptional regulator
VKYLYENISGCVSIQAIAEKLSIRWETAEKLVYDLAENGYVNYTKTKNFPFKFVVSLTTKGRKFAYEQSSPDYENLSLGELLLLLIIHISGERITGTTKLEKLPFLLEHDLNVRLDDVFHYFPHFYGPYSRDIIKSINTLAYRGFVDVTERVYQSETDGDKERIAREYRLTNKGVDFAETLFRRLPDEFQKRIVRLRPFAAKTTKELLKYVYSKYPEMKKYSRLDI